MIISDLLGLNSMREPLFTWKSSNTHDSGGLKDDHKNHERIDSHADSSAIVHRVFG